MVEGQITHAILKTPAYLKLFKRDILRLSADVTNIELKWHLALLLSRLDLTKKELGQVWSMLTKWATDKKESKIVRMNAVQGMPNLLQTNKDLHQDFTLTIEEILKENIASLNARIRKFRKAST